MSSTSSNNNKIKNVLIYPKNMPEESGMAALVHYFAKDTVDDKALLSHHHHIYNHQNKYKNK